MSSEGSGSTWSLQRYQLKDEIISAVASSGSTVGRGAFFDKGHFITVGRGAIGMSDEKWKISLRRLEIFRKAEAAWAYSLNYTYGRRARQRAALLDFPGHRTGYARPAGAGGGSRFLFFVYWLWLLMKHLHPTNWPGDLEAGGSGSTITFPSSPFNGIMYAAEASSGFTVGGGHALGAELNHMLASPGFTAARAGGHGHGGSPVFVDASGGHYLVININTTQQGDQGVAAAAQDGKRNLAQNALLSVFGSLVPACFTLLSGDNLLNGASSGYIKAVTCVGLGLVTGFTYLGLASKKRAMAAVRVVASMAMATVSIALVYTVSENVYIQCTCGIIGAVATLATMAIDW